MRQNTTDFFESPAKLLMPPPSPAPRCKSRRRRAYVTPAVAATGNRAGCG